MKKQQDEVSDQANGPGSSSAGSKAAEDRSLDPNLLDELTVLHKSEHFIVVNKEYDVRINAFGNATSGCITVAKQLAHRFPDLVDKGVEFGFRFTHRLDYATSGCLCVGLSKRAASHAGKAFQRRTTRKYYLALLSGHLEETDALVSGPGCRVIDIPIGQDGRFENQTAKLNKMCAKTSETASHCRNPKPARTKLLVLERGEIAGGGGQSSNETRRRVTKVLLKPETGRTHQLRVHALYIGHPIVGDVTYSTDSEESNEPRMYLHAVRLAIENKLEPIDVRTEDPFKLFNSAANSNPDDKAADVLRDNLFDQIDSM